MLSRERLYESVLTRLAPDKAAWLDQHRPSLRASWGWGPLNGQAGRQAIIRDLARSVDFDEVVETGTYRGTSTEFFAHVLGVPVLTVEGNPRFYHYAARRLAPYPDVVVEHGDSRSFLRRLATRPDDRTTLFYLDAHWHDDLPLYDEVKIIRDRWAEAVIVIDDFEVPGDPGYTFDDYGPGKRLCVDYLPPTEGWRLLFPALPAEQETGGRRGSAILVSSALSGKLEGLSTLRPG